MHATGIIRRIDDLGRLVIPKELRKQYRFNEGDNVEFYMDENQLILRKKEALADQFTQIDHMCKVLKKMFHQNIIFLNEHWMKIHNVSIDEEFMRKSKVYRMKKFMNWKVYLNDDKLYDGIIYPIVAYGEWFGGFVFIGKEELNESEQQVLEAFCDLLTLQQQ